MRKYFYAKKAGEMAEACFIAAAVRHGFTVSRPFGDSARYDFILECPDGTLLKIQVKSGSYSRYGAYCINAATGIAGRQPYSPGDFDFLAAYIIPADLWYIIPLAAFLPRQSLWFTPDDPARRPTWEPYREAWHVLTGR
jgi:PD-(D/E)XK endonuclease